MSPTPLLYEELKEEFVKQIAKTEFGVLATAAGDFVTAREMMIVSDGLTIWCFTSENTRKFKQMQENKNVALAINNLQIEGIVTLKGAPLDEENAEFLRIFKEKFPKSYEFWIKKSKEPDANGRVVEITPHKITAYKIAADTGPYLAILNIDTKAATKVDLDEMARIDYSRS